MKAIKPLLNYLLITWLASVLNLSNTFGQYALYKKPKKISSFEFGDILANPLKDGSLVEARVSQPALVAFRNSFQNVTDAKWYRVRQNYLVYFKRNKNLTKALYNVRGNLISSSYYGSEKDLPPDVKELVKVVYPDYDIVLAIEVYDEYKMEWVINMDNGKNLVTLSVKNGDIKEISHYEKSK